MRLLSCYGSYWFFVTTVHTTGMVNISIWERALITWYYKVHDWLKFQIFILLLCSILHQMHKKGISQKQLHVQYNVSEEGIVAETTAFLALLLELVSYPC